MKDIIIKGITKGILMILVALVNGAILFIFWPKLGRMFTFLSIEITYYQAVVFVFVINCLIVNININDKKDDKEQNND
jgi:hypothetical protein